CAGCGQGGSQDLGANSRTRRRAALAAQSWSLREVGRDTRGTTRAGLRQRWSSDSRLTGFTPDVAMAGRLLPRGESCSACSVRPADARSVEVMKGGGVGRRWLLAGSGAAAPAVD